jgi:phage terminase large subunit
MQAATKETLTFDFTNRDLYNPKYIPLFRNESDFLHLVGSAGSGKSRFEAQKEIVKSFFSERHGRKTLVCRKVGATLKDSVYSELNTVIHDWKLTDCFRPLKNPLEIENRITGVVFLFKGLDDIEKVKSISGVDRIWVEEATELDTYSELQQLRLRVRGFNKVQVTLSYNPINKFHWLNTEIHEMRPKGHFIFKTTYRDNVKMLARDPGYAVYIESLKETNPNYYKVYGLGEWGENPEGLVHPDYKTDYTEMPVVDGYGLDLGWNDPCALAEIAIRDLPKHDKRVLFANGRLYKSRLSPTDLVKECDNLGIDKNKPMACDGSWPGYIEELRRGGYFAFPVDKSKGSVKEGITKINELEFQIIAGNKEMLKEASNYSWVNKNGVWLDEPQDGADHYMNAIRYGVRASKAFPRAEELSYEEQRERSVPSALRLDAIAYRAPLQSEEQTERELATHDAYAGLAEILRKRREEDSNGNGHFSL